MYELLCVVFADVNSIGDIVDILSTFPQIRQWDPLEFMIETGKKCRELCQLYPRRISRAFHGATDEEEQRLEHRITEAASSFNGPKV